MDFILRPNELQQRFRASNMQDLIQLEQAFDLKPALVDEVKEEVKKEVASKAEGEFTVKDEFDVLFQFYPRFYVEEDAPGWNAVFHFDIAEVGKYTLTVQDGAATTAKGFEGSPTCVVETDATVLLALLFRERVQEAQDEDADEELADAELEAIAGGKGGGGFNFGGFNPVAVCAAEACGADGCAAAASGAGACGAAGCGAAACGADACGAAGCGGAACGAAACAAAACGAAAGGIGGCGADACGAAACGIVLTGADACGADACAVDVVPVVPGI